MKAERIFAELNRTRRVVLMSGIFFFCVMFCGKVGAQNNMIVNGSFELGLHNDWAHPYNGEVPLAMTDDGTATHGERSLRFDIASMHGNQRTLMLYKPIPVESNSVFTFSVDVKVDGENIRVSRVRTPLSNEWQRVSFPVQPKNGLLTVSLDVLGKGAVWIDGAMLVEGTEAAEFAPSADVETAIYTEQPGNIFLENEPVVIGVQGISYKEETEFVTRLTVWDYWGEQIWEKDVNLHLKPGEVVEEQVTLPLSLFGAFRAELSAPADGPVIAERVFTRMRDYVSADARAASPVCGHYGNYKQNLLPMAQRLGVPINRLHDGGSACFHWRDLEAKKGTWNFEESDKAVAEHERYGIEMLGILAAAPEWAVGEPELEAWPGKLPGREYLDDWENYVETVVKRYKGRVKYWEVWNEPYGLPPDYYFEIAKRAYNAAKRAWPEVQIVAPSGHRGHYWWMHQVNEMGMLDYCDIYSFHSYGTMAAGSKAMVELGRADGKDRPVWDTEGGTARDSTFYRNLGAPWFGEKGVDQNMNTAQIRSEFAAKSLVSLYAGGTERQFWYWNFFTYYWKGVASFSRSWAESCFEYDGAVHPMNVAHSLAGAMVSGFRPAGEINLGTARTLYLFENADECRVVVWDNHPRSATDDLTSFDPNWTTADLKALIEGLSGDKRFSEKMSFLSMKLPPEAKVLDIMTNPMKLAERDGIRSVPLTSGPVYMTFPNMNAAMVRDLFEKCAVENIGFNDLEATRVVIGREETSGKTGLILRVVNQKNLPAKGTVKLSGVKGAKLVSDVVEFEMGPFERKNVVFPIREGSALGTEIIGSYAVNAQGVMPITNDFVTRVLTAYRFDKSPVIDGDMGEWPVDDWIPIEMDTSYMETPYPPEDISARIWAGWDKEWLYFLVKVRDDDYIPAWGKPSGFWTQDCVEFFFDLGLFGNIDDTSLSGNHFQVMTVAGTKDNPDEPAMTINFPGTKIASQRLPDGYVIEYAFPIKYMSPLKAEVGSVIGLDFGIDDADTPEKEGAKPSRKLQMQWSTRKWEIWKTHSGYGVLVFGEENE